MFPKVKLIGDVVFNKVVGAEVISLPFSLDGPCTVIGDLQAWIGGGWENASGPLLSSDGLVHDIGNGPLK